MLNLGLGVLLTATDMGFGSVLAEASKQFTNFGNSLTTGYEAQLTHAATVAKQSGANFGLVGSDLSKFTSQATSAAVRLNIGSDEAAKSIRAFNDEGAALSAMGLKTSDDVAKMSKVFGISADDMRDNAHLMSTGLKMSSDQISQLTKVATAAGSEMGDVGMAMGGLTPILKQMSEAAEAQNISLDPAKLTQMGIETYKTAAGFRKLGFSEKEAMTAAMSMSQSQVDAKKAMQNLMAGTEEKLSSFFENTTIGFGDFNEAMKSASEGPAALEKSLIQLTKGKNMTADSLNFLRAHLDKAFDPGTVKLMIAGIQKGDASLFDMSEAAIKAHGDLGKAAKEGFSTGRTMSDEFQLAEAQMVKMFRDVGKPEAKKFLSETTEGMRDFGKKIKEIGGQGGLLGDLVHKLSEASSLGPAALLPAKWQPLAAIFGSVSAQLMPLIGQIKGFYDGMMSMLNPIGLLAGASAGLILMWSNEKANLQKNDKSYQTHSKNVEDLSKKLKKAHDPDSIKKYTQSLMDEQAEMDKMNRSYNVQAIKNMTDTILGWIKKVPEMVTEFFDQFTDASSDMNWGEIWTSIGDASDAILTGIGKAFDQIPWDKIYKGADDILGKIFGPDKWKEYKITITELWKQFKESAEEAWVVIKSIGEYIGTQFKDSMNDGNSPILTMYNKFIDMKTAVKNFALEVEKAWDALKQMGNTLEIVGGLFLPGSGITSSGLKGFWDTGRHQDQIAKDQASNTLEASNDKTSMRNNIIDSKRISNRNSLQDYEASLLGNSSSSNGEELKAKMDAYIDNSDLTNAHLDEIKKYLKDIAATNRATANSVSDLSDTPNYSPANQSSEYSTNGTAPPPSK